MQWVEFTIKTSSEAAEVIAERLAQLGAAGIATEDPLEFQSLLDSDDDTAHIDPSFGEDLPDYTRIRAYYPMFPDGVAYHKLEGVGAFSNVDTEKLYAEGSYPQDRISLDEFMSVLHDELDFISQFLETAPRTLTYEEVDELSWREKWKENYRPMHFSKHLFVVPTWEEFRNPPGTKTIRLDPGSAFGTGSHETTQLCAEFLDLYLAPSAKVLDLGTGSGILAIAAAKLGARYVRAIDISAHSVEVAKANVLQNGVEDKVVCQVGELRDSEGPYDIIVANLIAEVLIDLAPDFKDYLSDLGLLICSGIINTKLDQVLKAFRKAGYHVFAQEEKNDWYAVIFTK